MKENKNGFTLVELLIVMTIIVSLMIMAIGVINPIAMIGKARDTQRKSDLVKLKKAFEEYYNDKGYYPTSSELETWNVTGNCGKRIVELSKYLNSWLCDPDGDVYIMISKDNWFKVVTNLENKKDSDIPDGWYDENKYTTSGFDKNSVNYGVSSTNILWYEGSGLCDLSRCFVGTNCNAPVNNSCNEDVDGVCYLYSLSGTAVNRCNDPACKVKCCGVGCIE